MSGWKDFDQTTAGNNASIGAINWTEGQAPSTVNNTAREMMLELALGLSGSEFSVASSTVTDLSLFDANNVKVTGTTQIDDLGVVRAGIEKTLRFTDAITMKHSSGAITVPGSANLTIAANDSVRVVSDGGGAWRVLNYVPSVSAPNSPTLTSIDAGAAAAPTYTLNRNSASPAVGDVLGEHVFTGNNSAGGEVTYVRLAARTDQVTDGSEGGVLLINALNGGSDQNIMRLGSLGIVCPDGGGDPTGGDKGLGTINAKAVYDDNTLLTCYVFDQALDGDIDEDKWDAMAGVRTHEPMRKFKARRGDPLDIDKYADHWKTKRHLTSMPNETTFDPKKGMATGEWIQRLVETVEIQAVLIENMNSRLKILEP